MPRTALIADHRVDWPGPELAPLTDHARLAGDAPALRAALRSDGYLYLPGQIPRDAVLAARERIAVHMREHGALHEDRGDGHFRGRSGPLMGNRAITHQAEVLAAIEAPALRTLFAALFDEEPRTFDYKWLRAVPPDSATGAHMDTVYMGRGTPDLLTCWIPLGDIPVEQGTLAILEGSHQSSELAPVRDSYGRIDVDRDRVDGWFDHDLLAVSGRYGGRWLTSDFRAGDVVVFGMQVMHGSTANTTDALRLSCDVRWQAASAPIDERWIGDSPPGHSGNRDSDTRPMAEARKEMGV